MKLLNMKDKMADMENIVDDLIDTFNDLSERHNDIEYQLITLRNKINKLYKETREELTKYGTDRTHKKSKKAFTS